MGGYAAAARIRSVSPRLVRDGRHPAEPAGTMSLVEIDVLLVTTTDEARRAPAPTVAERWAAARERWSQLTFYLTDPNSWR